MAQVQNIRQNIRLQKYYIYDPAVTPGDEFGGLIARKDDNGVHVLAVLQQVQYWIDQGLAGQKPLGELSDTAKALLKQITRGRSEDNDANPKRVPKYSKQMQSGSPAYAGTLAERRRAAQKKAKIVKPAATKPDALPSLPPSSVAPPSSPLPPKTTPPAA
jgi:hypothetical protein